MGLPFLEIIEAVTPDPNLLMWKFDDADKEIKNGAQLTVRESQHALFFNEGQIADVFGPGRHKLSTENIPILTSLKSWKHGFESPFKADVYFLNTHDFIDNKWGTPAPIMMSDEKFGQVRIRAFGSYTIRIADPKLFFQRYAGTYRQLTIFELQNQLRDFIAPHFGEILANERIPVVEVAGNVRQLSSKIEPLLKPYFSKMGLELSDFMIASVTLPAEVSAFYDKVTNMNMVSDMDKLTQFNTAEAIAKSGSSVQNSVQDGVAMAMMMNQINQQNQQNQQNVSSSNTSSQPMDKLKQLKEMFDMGLIDEAEYKEKKNDILKDF